MSTRKSKSKAGRSGLAAEQSVDIQPVSLLSPHTHAGTSHAAGETITVSTLTARWLIEHGVAIATDNHEESN